MANVKKDLHIDETNDFGFSFVSDDEFNNKDEVSDLKQRLIELRKMFLPLLENLNKNPDKEMIKWPNRKDILDNKIKRLKELTDV
jgi:hypothetical protein